VKLTALGIGAALILAPHARYHVSGWTAQRNGDGNTIFTNDATGHGTALGVLALEKG
jgi:hypothetical protein